MQRKTKRRRQKQHKQTQWQHTTEKDTTHGVRALVLAFGFSEYREKFISSGKRKDEGERTNERTNGTERNRRRPWVNGDKQSVRCGSSRVTGRTGCETSATGSPGCFWPGILPLTWRHAVIHHSSTRPQSDPNLSYLIVSPLSDRSLEGLQPHLLGLHHGNLVGRPLNRLPPSGGSGIRVSVPWPQGHWRGPPATLRFFAPYHCASPLLRRVWE